MRQTHSPPRLNSQKIETNDMFITAINDVGAGATTLHRGQRKLH